MYSRFEQLLKENKVTAYRVSKETGVAQATLSDWKNGKSTPKYEKLSKIAEYFGVSVDWIKGETDEKKPLITNDKKQDDNIRFALWGGDADIVDDEMMQDVRDFAKLIAEKKKRKMKEQNDSQS